MFYVLFIPLQEQWKYRISYRVIKKHGSVLTHRQKGNKNARVCVCVCVMVVVTLQSLCEYAPVIIIFFLIL